MSAMFVYGTLLRGERWHSYLAGARFLGAVATAPAYSLYDMGAVDYPALVAQGATSVAGELYEVSAAIVAALDELEESPEYYYRAEILLADGRRAEGYLLPEGRLDGAKLIPGGCWRGRGRGIRNTDYGLRTTELE